MGTTATRLLTHARPLAFLFIITHAPTPQDPALLRCSLQAHVSEYLFSVAPTSSLTLHSISLILGRRNREDSLPQIHPLYDDARR